jgi:hypothetical protein
MSNTLNKKEIKQLVKLGRAIAMDLGCDGNDTALPCRSCRLEAIKNMKQYLEINGYRFMDFERYETLMAEEAK